MSATETPSVEPVRVLRRGLARRDVVRLALVIALALIVVAAIALAGSALIADPMAGT